MGRNKAISKELQHIIADLLKQKISHAEIAKIAGVSRPVVTKINIKLRKNQDLGSKYMGNKFRCRKTSLRDDRRIIRIIKENRKLSRLEICNKLVDYSIHISTRTLTRRMKENGLAYRRNTKNFLLTTAMARKRLNWAKKYKRFNCFDWDKVIFSDESMIQLNNDKAIKAIRTKDEKYHKHCVQGLQKHPIQVMIWSCISSKGVGPVYFVQGNMNATQYIHVLETVLKPLLPKWFRSRENFYFQQDGAPCHKAKVVTAALKKMNLNVLDWCGNAPDFNPIENVWHTLKYKVSKKQPKNLTELKSAIVEVWNSEKVRNCAKNAIASMPNRLVSCIRAKGWHTKN